MNTEEIGVLFSRTINDTGNQTIRATNNIGMCLTEKDKYYTSILFVSHMVHVVLVHTCSTKF